MKTTRRQLMAATVCAMLTLASGAAFSQSQTDKGPIRLLVGLSPGGSVDTAARLIAEKLSASLGRPVVVENKPGAGQRLALAELKRSAPDGRTLMVTTDGPFVLNPHVFRKLDYTTADFTPIAGVANFDLGLAVAPSSGIKDMKQFLAWARSNKGLLYGHPGTGTLPHFTGVALGQTVDLEVIPVPYKGGRPASIDLAGGQIPSIITGVSDMMEYHKAGRIRIIAVVSEQRTPVLPDVPTMKESGVNVSGTAKVGLYGPAGMQPALVKQFEQAVVAAAESAEVREKLLAAGMTPAPMTGQALAAAAQVEVKRLEAIVKASGYQPE